MEHRAQSERWHLPELFATAQVTPVSTSISPLAGHPAQAAQRVDVAKLVAAYYALQPDPSVPAQRVSFGTSGHRGTSFDKSFNEAHVLAITQAESVLGDWRLNECDLYVTKEPCPMCAGALVHVRMKRVIFGCPSEKDGAGGSLLQLLQHPQLNHRCEITHGVRR